MENTNVKSVLFAVTNVKMWGQYWEKLRLSCFIDMVTFHRHCLLIFLFRTVFSLHIQGSWSSSDFFTVLAKFGFQKTNKLRLEWTRGYIYGNITATSKHSRRVLLVLTNRGYFPYMYNARNQPPRSVPCYKMLKRMSKVAFDRRCLQKGTQDFFRWVPCPSGKLCPDEDEPKNVLPGTQLTFRTEDRLAPGFWYLILVACDLNSKCNWTEQTNKVTVDYDLWLVNGSPLMKYSNPFEHQFSFDEQDTAEIYFVAFLLYLSLALLQFRALVLVRNPSNRAKFLVAICSLKACGVLVNLTDVFIFSFNGDSYASLRWIGDILNIFAGDGLLILLIILLARGWAINTVQLKGPDVVFSVWGTALILQLIFFVWNSQAVDELEEIDIFETWPGWGILFLRFLLMVWFLIELRKTVQNEYAEDKAQFLVHFGSAFLVWFVYLLLLGVLSSQISLLWRFKIILAITYLADFVALCVLVHLFWPHSTNRRFFVDSQVATVLPQFDLDEFEKSLVEDEVPGDPEHDSN